MIVKYTQGYLWHKYGYSVNQLLIINTMPWHSSYTTGEFIRKNIPIIRSLFIAFIDTDIEFAFTELNFDIDRIFCIPQGHVFFPNC